MGLALEEEEDYWLERELIESERDFRNDDLVLVTGDTRDFFEIFFGALKSEPARF